MDFSITINSVSSMHLISLSACVFVRKQQVPYYRSGRISCNLNAGLSTYTAKNHYQRARPFMVNNTPICTPEEEALLREDGSYPSGHTAIGWAWALILTEVFPEQADAILEREKQFGISRNVCNVHWHSDVVYGRMMGAAAVAMLHSNSDFIIDLKAAKEEKTLKILINN